MGEEQRPEWMTSIASTVNQDDYLLGRKIDKTFELSQKERAEKARKARIDLIAQDKIKLSDDPILDLERRRRDIKIQIMQNPVLLKQFRNWLLKETKYGSEQEATSETRDRDTARSVTSPSRERSRTNGRRTDRTDDRREEGKDRHHSRHRDSLDRHRDDRSEHRDDDRSRHRESRDHRPKDHDTVRSDSRRDSSSRRHESDRKSRHSNSRSKHSSSYRSRSPSSSHRHRHSHHEKRGRSRSPSYR